MPRKKRRKPKPPNFPPMFVSYDRELGWIKLPGAPKYDRATGQWTGPLPPGSLAYQRQQEAARWTR